MRENPNPGESGCSNPTHGFLVFRETDEEGRKGLYEARIELGSSIWRIFCFFDQQRLVILLNRYAQKVQQTSRMEIERAKTLMREYGITWPVQLIPS